MYNIRTTSRPRQRLLCLVKVSNFLSNNSLLSEYITHCWQPCYQYCFGSSSTSTDTAKSAELFCLLFGDVFEIETLNRAEEAALYGNFRRVVYHPLTYRWWPPSWNEWFITVQLQLGRHFVFLMTPLRDQNLSLLCSQVTITFILTDQLTGHGVEIQLNVSTDPPAGFFHWQVQ